MAEREKYLYFCAVNAADDFENSDVMKITSPFGKEAPSGRKDLREGRHFVVAMLFGRCN